MVYVIELRASDAIMGAADEGRPDFVTVHCSEFVQLTYDDLRVGPDGESAAHWDPGSEAWYLHSTFGPLGAAYGHLGWSDIVITAVED